MKKHLALLATILLLAVAAAAQPRPLLDSVVNSLYGVHNFAQTAISPDGTRVAWVEFLHDASGAPTWNTAIFVRDISSSSEPRRRLSRTRRQQ